MLRPRKLTLEVFIALLFGVTALHAVLTVSRSLTSYTANIGFPFSFYTQVCNGALCTNSLNLFFLIPDVVIFYLIAFLVTMLYTRMKNGSHKTHTFSLPKIPKRSNEKKRKEAEEKKEEKDEKKEEPAAKPANKPEYEADEEPLFDKDEVDHKDDDM